MSLVCRLGIHQWRLIVITDELWPLHYGHTEQHCERCGKRRTTR